MSLAAGFVSALAGLVSAVAGLVSALDDEREAQAISTRTPLKFVVFISASGVPPGVVAAPVLASGLESALSILLRWLSILLRWLSILLGRLGSLLGRGIRWRRLPDS